VEIHFAKMHGLGNDFVVIDAISQAVNLTAAQMKRIADRHFGIGCDQILLVEKPQSTSAEFRYRIFNADGGEVEQCGNGARCFARFVRAQGLTNHDTINVETNAGEITLKLLANGQVEVDMGPPVFEPEKIPFLAADMADQYVLNLGQQSLQLGVLSMGNPHAVLIVDKVVEASVERLGAAIETHACFPNHVNVGFMEVVNAQHIRLRVYERGVGETLACGSGACAAVVYGQKIGLLAENVTVELAGGCLNVRWLGVGSSVIMLGPASYVFSGVIDLDV